MATNRGNTVTGYVFPNPPEKWSLEEKRFALALRGLFDTLFQKTRGLQSDFEKGSYKSLTDKPSINGQVLIGNRGLSDLGIHNVNEDDAGLMTPELLGTLIDVDAEVDFLMTQSVLSQLNEIRAGLDYLAMMSEIEIPTDTGNKVTKVTYYYNTEAWNQAMVYNAVGLWITAADYEAITGEPYVPVNEPQEEEGGD